MSFCQFEGPPCLRHNNYVFYKAFKYKYGDHSKILALGEFFFLKILQEIPICIGEVELLWEDKASNQFLTSLRLYFRPEHTPDGRQDDTGQDEVVALGERLVLRLDDLVKLIQHNIKWTYGCNTYCSGRNKSRETNGDISDGCEKGKRNRELTAGSREAKNGMVVKDEPGRKRSLSFTNAAKMEDLATKNAASGAANLAVMSYPKYCRYRAIQKRLEGCESEWVCLAVVMAIGGFSGRAPGCRVMFCRDTFYQPEIDDLDIRMDHLLPVLKGRPKGKKCRQLSRKDSQQDSDSMEEMFANITPSISSSTRPRRLTESSDINEEKVSTEEQTFLIGLHKFMHDSKMPIGRIPSLGFKQIDLYYFYKQAEDLGGYDSITHKRMWKHLYDKLGGNSSNTSAATCTRKHYERLLLPYERHLRKLKVGKAKKKRQKQVANECNIKSDVLLEMTLPVINESVDVIAKSEVPEEVETLDIKENVQVNSSENLTIPKESENKEEKLMLTVLEHSKVDLQGESEVLELPLVKNDVKSDSDLPSVEPVTIDESNNLPQISFSQTEQRLQQAGKSSASLPSNTFVVGENPILPYTDTVYKAGYLVPILPQHMLQTSWGVMGPPSSSSSSSSGSSPQIRPEVVSSQPINSFKDPSTSLFVSSKTNIDAPIQNNRSKLAKKQLLSSHLPSSSGNDIHTSALINTPYKSSPYLLKDPSQPARKVSHSSHHVSPIGFSGSSSQNLASLLHPTPPGHRNHPHLPPAPTTIYLNPSSINPFSQLQSRDVSPPPPAHCHPRKRVYPFNSPSSGLFPSPTTPSSGVFPITTTPSSGLFPSPTTPSSGVFPITTASSSGVFASPTTPSSWVFPSLTTPSSGVFPSPDIVLDRIRNSTGLPRSNAVLANHLSTRQRFEDPRHIFRQTPQTMVASHNVSPQQRKESHFQHEVNNGKVSNTKSKNSKKCHQAYTVYNHMSSPELQQALLHPGHVEHRPSNITKVVDQIKPSNNLNGMFSANQSSKSVTSAHQTSKSVTSAHHTSKSVTSAHHTSKSVTSVPQASPVPSSSKGGRLTSALFGTQFTAVPRSSKPSELTSQQSLFTDQPSAALSAISLNPHLHPAFMSPYLPVSTAATPQFQMLAGAFASPAQLAAYEEMLRQNGYGAFLTAAAQGKIPKKN